LFQTGHDTQVVRRKRTIAIGATAAVALAMAFVFGIWICIFKRKSKKSPAGETTIHSFLLGLIVYTFAFSC